MNAGATRGQGLPKISVVTPSYNQGQYIEKTIRSVLDQGYPNLEYIIVDGGSQDGAVDVIQRHADRLAWWVSEKDHGQSHAINKGLAAATGDILCWLNSDDYFAPDTLTYVAEKFAAAPDLFAISGQHVQVRVEDGSEYLANSMYRGRRRLLQYWRSIGMHQPSIFWRREVTEKVGPLREDLHLVMDYEYWLRISRCFDFLNVDRVLSFSHYHAQAKTGGGYAAYNAERRKLALELIAQEPWSERLRIRLSKLRDRLRSRKAVD